MTRIRNTIFTVNRYYEPDAEKRTVDKLLRSIRRDLGLDAHPARVRSPFTDSG